MPTFTGVIIVATMQASNIWKPFQDLSIADTNEVSACNADSVVLISLLYSYSPFIWLQILNYSLFYVYKLECSHLALGDAVQCLAKAAEKVSDKAA